VEARTSSRARQAESLSDVGRRIWRVAAERADCAQCTGATADGTEAQGGHRDAWTPHRERWRDSTHVGGLLAEPQQPIGDPFLLVPALAFYFAYSAASDNLGVH
jgi:hypothetical protein